jgi:FAD dependent oxidoreductase TIGR03364
MVGAGGIGVVLVEVIKGFQYAQTSAVLIILIGTVTVTDLFSAYGQETDRMTEKFDALIVGAGIVGLAHAVEAARRGLRVAIVERDHLCIGASVRNFGFITVTGQPEGEAWRRARRTRDLWLRITSEASIPIEQRGLWVIGRRKAAAAVLEEFLSTDMGRECRVLSAAEIQQTLRYLNLESAAAVLYSPHEIRVESRVAIPRLAEWLERVHGVRIFWEQRWSTFRSTES